MDKTTQFLNNLPKVLDDDGGIAPVPDSTIIENSIKFIKSLPTYYQKMIDPENCITATPYGTVTIDWYHNKKFISVEIGKTKIGWFSETDRNVPDSNGVVFGETPPKEIIECLDSIYSRTKN